MLDGVFADYNQKHSARDSVNTLMQESNGLLTDAKISYIAWTT